jgi:ABC-2 type transport system ATP-binding protein
MFSSHLVSEVEQVAQRVGIIQAGSARFEGLITDLRTQVRRIDGLDGAAGGAEPPGLQRLRADVYRADAATWDALVLPPGARVEALSLEDIFLAFARTDGVRPA